MPLEVFVYQRRPLPPGSEQLEDSFVNIASAADLQEYPVGSPGPDAPFFRLPEFDILYRSPDLLTIGISDVKRDLDELVRNLDQLDAAGAETSFTAGTAPP